MFKVVLAFYLGLARERVKRCFHILNATAGNTLSTSYWMVDLL
jgi:hypothetical protein